MYVYMRHVLLILNTTNRLPFVCLIFSKIIVALYVRIYDNSCEKVQPLHSVVTRSCGHIGFFGTTNAIAFKCLFIFLYV